MIHTRECQKQYFRILHLFRWYKVRNFSLKETESILREHGGFLVLLVCAVLMNISLLVRFPNVGGDTLVFLLPIHHWIAGDGYSFDGKPELLFSPGYGILCWIVNLLVRDIEYSGMIVSGLSYVGIVLISYICVYRLIHRRAGEIVAIILTFSPSLVALSYISLADLPVAFVIVLSAFMTILSILNICSKSWHLILGGILGFGVLIRPDCLIIAGGAIFLIASSNVIKIQKKEISFGRGVLLTALVVASFLACIFPYMNFLHDNTGKWTVSNKLALVAVGGSGVSSLAVDASFIETLINQIFGNFANTFVRIRENALLCLYSFIVCNFFLLVPMVSIWLLYPFFACRCLSEYIHSYHTLFWGIAVLLTFSSPLLPYLLYAREDRRWIPYWTLFVIAAGVFVYYLIRGMLEDVDKKAWLVVHSILIILVVLSPFIPVPKILYPHSLYESLSVGHGHYGLRAAGLWLRDNVPLEDRTKILSRKPSVVVFYAYNKNIAPTYGTGLNKGLNFEQTLEKIDQSHLKYLVLDAHYIKEMPNLYLLWQDPALGEKQGLLLVSSPTNNLFKIFRRTN